MDPQIALILAVGVLSVTGVMFVVGVALGDRVDAALGGREGLVGVRRPHVEQFDVAVAAAVLSAGDVDVGGLVISMSMVLSPEALLKPYPSDRPPDETAGR